MGNEERKEGRKKKSGRIPIHSRLNNESRRKAIKNEHFGCVVMMLQRLVSQDLRTKLVVSCRQNQKLQEGVLRAVGYSKDYYFIYWTFGSFLWSVRRLGNEAGSWSRICLPSLALCARL